MTIYTPKVPYLVKFASTNNPFSSIFFLNLQKFKLILMSANKRPKILIKNWNIYQKCYFLSKFASFTQLIKSLKSGFNNFYFAICKYFWNIKLNKKITIKCWAYGEIHIIKPIFGQICLDYPVFQGGWQQFLSTFFLFANFFEKF